MAAGHKALVPVGIFDATEKHVFEHAARTNPIYFEYPYQEYDDVSLEIPPAWQVSSLPQGANLPAHIVEYTLKVDNDNGKLYVARRLNVDFLYIEAKYYSSLRAFFETVRKNDEGQIVLQPGSTAAGN